ncbi:hypothetical protein KCP75_17380 [Salmonella enterica subsp. enterica]|nr:hypothetical protein KCP75_17380 [Salmonella enterica subsp. enterica]
MLDVEDPIRPTALKSRLGLDRPYVHCRHYARFRGKRCAGVLSQRRARAV